MVEGATRISCITAASFNNMFYARLNISFSSHWHNLYFTTKRLHNNTWLVLGITGGYNARWCQRAL